MLIIGHVILLENLFHGLIIGFSLGFFVGCALGFKVGRYREE